MDEGVLGREYADGETICKEGEPGDRMFIIQSGSAIVLRREGASNVPVGELKPGDVFGEMAIFERKPRSATVRARGTTRVLTLDKRAFLRNVHQDPSLAYRVLEGMSQRIRNLDAELSRLKTVAKTINGAPTTTPKYLCVVSPEHAELAARLRQSSSADERLAVIEDRRKGFASNDGEAGQPERRRAEPPLATIVTLPQM